LFGQFCAQTLGLINAAAQASAVAALASERVRLRRVGMAKPLELKDVMDVSCCR
jgi:hypothetical protein